jgi:hypothetical protein
MGNRRRPGRSIGRRRSYCCCCTATPAVRPLLQRKHLRSPRPCKAAGAISAARRSSHITKASSETTRSPVGRRRDGRMVRHPRRSGRLCPCRARVMPLAACRRPGRSELLSIFENVSVFHKAPPQPSNGLCGLSVVVRCAAPRPRVPRRGEDRFRNPFIQITRKGKNRRDGGPGGVEVRRGPRAEFAVSLGGHHNKSWPPL